MDTQPNRATGDAEPAFRYCDPYSPPGSAVEPYVLRLDRAKPAPIVGLVSNLFPDATPLLNDLKVPLQTLLPAIEFRHYDKGSRRASSFPMEAALLGQISRECDAAIAAYGHCGSCTNGTIRDALNLVRAGLPVVALVTEKFLAEAGMILRSEGTPGIPLVTLPHPTAGREAAFHRALAQAIAPDVLAALTEGASNLRAPALRAPHAAA